MWRIINKLWVEEAFQRWISSLSTFFNHKQIWKQIKTKFVNVVNLFVISILCYDGMLFFNLGVSTYEIYVNTDVTEFIRVARETTMSEEDVC